jgi:undecaprenyl-diphosphatase
VAGRVLGRYRTDLGGCVSRYLAIRGHATAYEAFDLYESGHVADENWTELGIGFVVSAVVAFIAVKWLLRYVQTHSFTPFGWYRIVVGLLLLAMVI